MMFRLIVCRASIARVRAWSPTRNAQLQPLWRHHEPRTHISLSCPYSMCPYSTAGTDHTVMAAQTPTQRKEQKLTSPLDSYVEEHHLTLGDTIRNKLADATATNDVTRKIGLQFLLELVNDSGSGSGSASETIRNLDVEPSSSSNNRTVNNNDVSISISQNGEENMCPREAIQLIINETSVNMRDSLVISVTGAMFRFTKIISEEGETFSDQDMNFPGGDSEIKFISIGFGRKDCILPVHTGFVSLKDVQTAVVEIGIKELPAVDIAKVLATLNRCRINVLHNEPTEIQELVPTEPQNFMAGDQAGVPASKAQAIVIAGESGSGKSRFIMDQLYKEKFAILRYSFTKNDYKDKTPVSENLEYGRFIAMDSMEFYDMKKTETDLYKNIRSIAKIINKTRDTWAFEKATTILQELISSLHTEGEDDASNWLNQQLGGEKIKLDRLAIVFDECGNHMEFVYGMISSLRDHILPKFGNLASSVVLVLCGTGLDVVRVANDKMGTVGSDPNLSQLVLMKSTNLGALGMDLQQAIEAGSYSSILGSNARMLTMGIMPVLTSDIVCKHVSGEDLTTRQTAFGSFWLAMDFGVRVYINMNGLKDATPENLHGYLCKSFLYMLRWSRLSRRARTASKSKMHQ
eukprot:scaffold89101_cov65-Attheya_sp.AAC.2